MTKSNQEKPGTAAVSSAGDGTVCTAAPSVPASIVRRRAEHKRDQRLKRFRRELRVVAPHLDDPKFARTVEAFGINSLLVRDSYALLRERGLLNENGELRSSIDTLQRLMGLQLKLARELGLTPAVLGKIRNEKPVDLAGAFAETDGEPS